MADQLIRVNHNVSVMASQVTAVTAPDYGETVLVHTADGEIHHLAFSFRNERWAAKSRFEQQVNAALNGDKQ